jgi:hypothetical protein
MPISFGEQRFDFRQNGEGECFKDWIHVGSWCETERPGGEPLKGGLERKVVSDDQDWRVVRFQICCLKSCT